MSSDGDSSHDRVSRLSRPREDDDDRLSRNDRDRHRRSRDEHDNFKRRRERSRSRSRDLRRKDRRRSRTPDSPRRRRSRSRDRDRRRERDRDHDRDRGRRRYRDSDRDRKHRRESPDAREPRSRRRRHEDDVSDGNRSPTRQRSPLRRGGSLPSQADSFAVVRGDTDEPPKPKEKPNFGNSGVLAAASNAVQQADGSTITLKYHEPPEARKPPSRDDWRLFVFKGEDALDTIHLSARSCWLVGREVAIVDMPAEHPSISKQHAVIQFRYIEKRNEFGDRVGRVKPYLIDLESANGTFLNGSKVAETRYVELRDKDVIKFGHSTREYVLMLAPRG